MKNCSNKSIKVSKLLSPILSTAAIYIIQTLSRRDTVFDGCLFNPVQFRLHLFGVLTEINPLKQKWELNSAPPFHCCHTAVNLVLLISILQRGFLTVLRASFTRSSSRLAWMWTAKDSELFIIANLIPYSTWPLYDQRLIRTLDGNIIWSGGRSSINWANKP